MTKRGDRMDYVRRNNLKNDVIRDIEVLLTMKS